MPNETHQYGELVVTVTSDYDWVYSDYNTHGKYDAAFYTPVIQGGDLRPLGSVGISNYTHIDGKRGTVIVGPANSGSTCVAMPTGYTKIWDDDGSIWRPIAPSGYRSMGDVVVKGYKELICYKVAAVWCLREDLTKLGRFASTDFWNDKGSKADDDVSCWDIHPEPGSTDGSVNISINVDTFRAKSDYSKPDGGLAWVPVLNIKNDFVRFAAPVPTFTKDNIPNEGDNYGRILQCQVTLPFTAHFSATDSGSLVRIQKPFITVRRFISWHAEQNFFNRSDGQITNTHKVTCGISQEKSKSVTNSMGVEVSASYGVGLAQAGISLNYQFTETNTSSYREWREETITKSFDVPKNSCTTVFSKHIWLSGQRSDGTEINGAEIAANESLYLSACAL